MKKKSSPMVPGQSLPRPAGIQWHNGGDLEIHAYAEALQQAARALLERMLLAEHPQKDRDAGPILLLYRQALELHLKMLVGEGSNFLQRETDPITLSQTHSLRWLAQIVAQIIKAVNREDEFKCDGVKDLADFSILVNDIEALDPVTRIIRSAKTEGPGAVSKFYRTFDIVEFGKRMDALLVLLSMTTDELAATWEMKKTGVTEQELLDGLGSGETVH